MDGTDTVVAVVAVTGCVVSDCGGLVERDSSGFDGCVELRGSDCGVDAGSDSVCASCGRGDCFETCGTRAIVLHSGLAEGTPWSAFSFEPKSGMLRNSRRTASLAAAWRKGLVSAGVALVAFWDEVGTTPGGACGDSRAGVVSWYGVWGGTSEGVIMPLMNGVRPEVDGSEVGTRPGSNAGVERP